MPIKSNDTRSQAYMVVTSEPAWREALSDWRAKERRIKEKLSPVRELGRQSLLNPIRQVYDCGTFSNESCEAKLMWIFRDIQALAFIIAIRDSTEFFLHYANLIDASESLCRKITNILEIPVEPFTAFPVVFCADEDEYKRLYDSANFELFSEEKTDSYLLAIGRVILFCARKPGKIVLLMNELLHLVAIRSLTRSLQGTISENISALRGVSVDETKERDRIVVLEAHLQFVWKAKFWVLSSTILQKIPSYSSNIIDIFDSILELREELTIRNMDRIMRATEVLHKGVLGLTFVVAYGVVVEIVSILFKEVTPINLLTISTIPILGGLSLYMLIAALQKYRWVMS